MGIYDREYYRGETSGSGWLTGQAPACKAIIAANVVAFLLGFIFAGGNQSEEAGFNAFAENWLVANPDAIFRHGYVWQLLTATFLHAGPMHLFWNMLFLWMFGREMEQMYGTRDFTAFYFTAALISTFGWAFIEFNRPHAPYTIMLGASGAVTAVAVLYALYYPHRELLVMFVVRAQMWLIVTAYILIDAYQFFYQPNVGNAGVAVAVGSHLTGAGYGYLFKRYDLRWSKFNWRRMRRPRLRLVVPEPREKVSPRTSSSPSWSSDNATSARPSATAVVSEEVLDAKLDEILAKIAREGREGLTEEENRILQEASRRARNRRSDRL